MSEIFRARHPRNLCSGLFAYLFGFVRSRFEVSAEGRYDTVLDPDFPKNRDTLSISAARIARQGKYGKVPATLPRKKRTSKSRCIVDFFYFINEKDFEL